MDFCRCPAAGGPCPWLYLAESSFLLQLLQTTHYGLNQSRDFFLSLHNTRYVLNVAPSYHTHTAMIKPHLFNQSVNPLRLRSLTTEYTSLAERRTGRIPWMNKAECGFMILCGTNGRTQTPRMAARDQIPDSAMHLLRASTPSHVKRSQTLQSCLKHRLILRRQCRISLRQTHTAP